MSFMRACYALPPCSLEHTQAQVHAYLLSPYPMANGTLGIMNKLHTSEIPVLYIYKIVLISFQGSLCS